MRYHDLLKDIAEGKMEVSTDRLARILEQVTWAQLDPQYNITPYARLSEALAAGDMDALIAVMGDVAPDAGQWTYLIMYDNACTQGITEAQKTAWAAIAEKLRPVLAKDQLMMLDSMLTAIESRREKRLRCDE